jgi:hypothetical protein
VTAGEDRVGEQLVVVALEAGRRAVITTPELSEKALAGEIGTQVTP